MIFRENVAPTPRFFGPGGREKPKETGLPRVTTLVPIDLIGMRACFFEFFRKSVI
ncbi:MAG: hypothetical protein KIG36_03230 [Eubacteriales bacterium]|nr:hypothetical protein [Eubacteriales bacterium]